MIRASQLPVVSRCSAVAYYMHNGALDSEPGEAPSAPAMSGTAIHAALDTLITEGRIDIDSIPDSQRWKFFRLRRLLLEGWPERGMPPLKPLIEQCERVTEELLQDGFMSGHPDLMCHHAASETLYVFDWKTGHTSYSHVEQLLGYAALATRCKPWGWKRAVMFQVNVAQEADDVWQATRADVVRWYSGLKDRVNASRTAPEAPRIADHTLDLGSGGHCQRCPVQGACTAVSHRLAGVKAFVDGEGFAGQIQKLRPDDVVRFYGALQAMEERIRQAKEAVRVRVAADGGTVDGGDAGRLELQSLRKTVPVPYEYAALLSAGAVLPDMTVAEAVKVYEINHKEVLAAVRARAKKAGRAMKEAEEEAVALLTAGGALLVTEGPPRLVKLPNKKSDAPATALPSPPSTTEDTNVQDVD
jgi:hypothetical protein